MTRPRTLPILLLILSVLTTPATSQDEDPSDAGNGGNDEWEPPTAACTGELSNSGRCHHGSTCLPGPSDYGTLLSPFADSVPFLAETDVDGEHCECGSTHTGISCEHRYEICNPTVSGFACFHDAECVKLHEGKYACDCSTARWAGKPANFAGESCQFGHKDTEVCDTDGSDGLEEAQWFCVNGGSCTGRDNINKKCKCGDGWTGPHCEFKVTNEDAPKEEECTLECDNGGQCKHGIKDYGAHKGDSTDPDFIIDVLNLEKSSSEEGGSMHCVCPDGYTGLTCQVEVEDCEDSDAGKFHCYNGSRCSRTTLTDGTKKHYCDCQKANNRKFSFAGEFCQYKSTSMCNPVEGQKASLYFCVNFGVCPDEASKYHEQCFCPPGFTGHQCEVRGSAEEGENVTPAPPACNLECKNGGVCRHGVADFGHSETFDLPFQKTAHIDFEHCSCPEGYTGVDCSIKLEICGDMEHVCAHGAGCTQSESGGYGCDCKDATDAKGKSVAGRYCENRASDMCIRGDSSGGGHSFCVNGGSCVGLISSSEPHPGCLCKSGFHGSHCEFKTSSATRTEPETTKSTKRAAIMFSLMVVIIGFVIFAAVLATRKFATGKEMDTGSQGNSDVFDAEGAVPKTESSEDGELTDVEII